MPFIPDNPEKKRRFVPEGDVAAAAPDTSDDTEARRGLFGGIPEAAVSLGSSALAGPISGLAGIAGAALPGPEGQGADWVRKVQEAMTVEPKSRGGKMIVDAASYLPGKLAEGADWAGGHAADISGSPAVGAEVNALLQAIPFALVPAASRAVGGALKGETPLIGARDMMTRALRPDKAARESGSGRRAVTTLLGEDQPPVAGGAGLVRGGYNRSTENRLGGLESQMDSVLGPSGARTPVQPVLDRLLPLLDDAMNDTTAAREPRIQAIQNAWDAVLNNPHVAGARDVPVQRAQAFKREINPQTAGEYGAEGATQAIKNAKAVQGGWREGVATSVPAAADINAQMGPLINASDLVQQRIGIAGNRGLGFSPLSHSVEAFVSMLASSSPLAMSLLAHMLNKTGNLALGAGEVAGPAGVAMQPEMSERERKKRLMELLGSR